MYWNEVFLQHCEGQLLTQGPGSGFLSSRSPAGCKSRKRISVGYPGCALNSNFASLFLKGVHLLQWILAPGFCKIIQKNLFSSKALKMPRKIWKSINPSIQGQSQGEEELQHSLSPPLSPSWDSKSPGATGMRECREGSGAPASWSGNSSPPSYSDLQDGNFGLFPC